MANDITSNGNYADLFKEIGKIGEISNNLFLKEENRVDDLRLEDYRRMLNNDGQIQMLWNAICNTIMSAGSSIIEDKNWQQENPSPEKDFIEKNLFNPLWGGGMTRSLELTNRTILRAFVEGYRIFEIIYRKGEDGKIYLDKLAPRSGSNDTEIRIAIDENGNFNGFKQWIAWGGSMVKAEVYNNGSFKKAVKATFGEEFGSLYGRSGLKAAWYHYDKAHKAMFLNHVGLELGAIKFRHLKTKTMNPTQTKNLVEDLTKVHQKSVIAIPENEADLIFETVSDSGVMAVGKDMINLHFSLMAKSILAQFIDLGTNITDTGSRSLGQDQSDFFKEGLQALATILIENTWNEVIADLIKINFNNGIYPQLKVNKINDRTADNLLQLFSKLVEKGEITDSIRADIINKSGNYLGMDISGDQIVSEMDQQKKDAAQQQQDKLKILQANVKSKSPTQLADMTTESVNIETMPPRPLFPDEEKVRLSDIKRKLTIIENSATQVLSAKLQKVKQKIVDNYIQASRSGFKALKKVNIELAENSYSDELYNLANEAMEFGKIGASNEMDISVPTTTKSDRLQLQNKVDIAVQDQSLRLRLRLEGLAQNALSAKMPENQLQVLLDNEFDDFFNKVLNPTVQAIIPESLNQGRAIAFDSNRDNIFAYRYTAVLDDRTTDYCRSLDGKVFQKNDPDFYMLTPPNHYGCRSIWTPILKSESDGVRVDGKPLDIPVYGSLNSFKDVSTSDIIADINKVFEL